MSGGNWRGVVRLSFVAALRYVRLTPFDVQTEQGRRDERYRVALLSILANVLSRVVGVVLTLLSVSLTLPYLGVERFGIWMTVASFAAMLTFLDLGGGQCADQPCGKQCCKDICRAFALHPHGPTFTD